MMKRFDVLDKYRRTIWTVLAIVLIGVLSVSGQQQQSGGLSLSGPLPAGSNQIGHVVADAGSTTAVTGNVTAVQATGSNLHVAVDSAPTTAVTGTFFQATQPVSGTVTNGTGVANIGIVRVAPSPCTQSTNFSSSTVGVATGAGTSVSAVTTCVTMVYVNNITNSAVTFQLADKTGTPIIWVGGNANFTIPANSNVAFPLGGVTFANGITAIAGTASALNLQIAGLQ